MALLLMDGLQQPPKFIVRVDVRTESVLNARGWFLKWGTGEESSRNEIAEEATQGSMLPFPEAGRKAFTAAELPTVFRGDVFEPHLPHDTDEGAQDSSVDGKDGT
jgi:hypothetical protein